jgi:hypothetical protein
VFLSEPFGATIKLLPGGGGGPVGGPGGGGGGGEPEGGGLTGGGGGLDDESPPPEELDAHAPVCAFTSDGVERLFAPSNADTRRT